MKLFLIMRPDPADYDQFDSAVVCCDTAEEAKTIHPNESWMLRLKYWETGTWVEQEKVIVKEIGTANGDIKRGVVCASFNAG